MTTIKVNHSCRAPGSRKRNFHLGKASLSRSKLFTLSIILAVGSIVLLFHQINHVEIEESNRQRYNLKSKQDHNSKSGSYKEDKEGLNANVAAFEATVTSDASPTSNANTDRTAAKGRYIKCYKSNLTELSYVTPEEFYSEDSKCSHSFKADTVLFHVGKGGGGTLMSHFFESNIQYVHPRPNTTVNNHLRNGPLRTLIVNLRDPVDRFVSAFNWRNAVLCHPNDMRQKVTKSDKLKATDDPLEFCKIVTHEEILLRRTYQSNPSNLAEALCHGSQSRSLAQEDYRKIGHSTTLAEWLDFLIAPRLVENITDDGIQQLIVLPVEQRPSAHKTLFEKYIDNLMLHLLQNQYGAEASKEMMRLDHEQKAKRERNGPSKQQDHTHSSVKFYNSTPPLLTKLGECCLARHLKDDYRLIESMLGNESKVTSNGVFDPIHGSHPVIQRACSWGDEQQQRWCRGDLESMLIRRARYLDESKGSCSAIVSVG